MKQARSHLRIGQDHAVNLDGIYLVAVVAYQTRQLHPPDFIQLTYISAFKSIKMILITHA